MTLSVNPRRITQSYQPIRNFRSSQSAHANAAALAAMDECQLATGLTRDELAEQQRRMKDEAAERRARKAHTETERRTAA